MVGALESKKVLLPIDALKILSEGEGEVALYRSNGEIEKKTVKILMI
jgi:hypothetical protein